MVTSSQVPSACRNMISGGEWQIVTFKIKAFAKDSLHILKNKSVAHCRVGAIVEGDFDSENVDQNRIVIMCIAT